MFEDFICKNCNISFEKCECNGRECPKCGNDSCECIHNCQISYSQCEGAGYWDYDPFVHEIHGEFEYSFICSECSYSLAMEI